MIDESGPRPDLSTALSEQEFRRWYWLKEELRRFARSLGISASGSKDVLSARIAAHLSGRPFDEPARRRPDAPQMVAPLNHSTVIPRGQRCSQLIRTWFIEHVGSRFTFDEPMRQFFAETDGSQTLADALAHWHATREVVAKPIGAQFEYNRFTRAWRLQHPEGTREQLLADWRAYRSRAIDERGRV